MTDAKLSPGILPCQAIDALIAQGAITSPTAFDADQVQPASLDLRLDYLKKMRDKRIAEKAQKAA